MDNVHCNEFGLCRLTQNLTRREYPVMKIFALDLGKYKTVGCDYESESGAHQFKRGCTTPAGLAKMVQEVKPDRVVIEVCSIAGWVCDLLWGLGIEVQVANTSDDAWRWRKVKQKDDRRDALKAARLSAVNQVREVNIPAHEDQESHSRSIAARRADLKARQRLLERSGVKTAGGAGSALQRMWA